MFLAKIKVLLKESILDPQGTSVKKALENLGYKEAKDVRIGKYIEIQINLAKEREAKKKIEEYCQTLLVNSSIESYNFSLEKISS